MARTGGKDTFLNGMESWINEVVAQQADGHNDKIPGMIKDGFEKSMTANIEFHRDMAKALDGVEDSGTMAKYHNLMADIYTIFMHK